MKSRTEAFRATIVEAAASVFLEMGYERASMNEVTKRRGGSKATLYSYFASKEELFVAVVQMYAVAHLADAVSDVARDAQAPNDLKGALVRFAEKMLNVLTNDNTALAVYRMVIAEAGRSDVGMLFYESGPRECVNVLAQLMASAMQNGEIRTGDPKIFALQFLSLVTAETELRVFMRTSEALALPAISLMVERAVDMFLAGATPR